MLNRIESNEVLGLFRLTASSVFKYVLEGTIIMSVDCVCVSAAILIILLASVSDVRTREVSDVHWMALAILAVVLSVGTDLFAAFLRIFAIILVSLYLFSEKVVGPRALSVMILAYLMFFEAYLESGDQSVLVTMASITIILVLYHARIIRGGADAKALAVLSMAFPAYPELNYVLWSPEYPEALVFNPVFSTMAVALVVSCAMPIMIMIGKRGREPGFNSFVMSLEEARSSFVWPVQDYVEGKLVTARIPEESEAVYDRLEANGIEKVRVTPMIPFILPIAIGFTTTMVLGSPLFALT